MQDHLLSNPAPTTHAPSRHDLQGITDIQIAYIVVRAAMAKQLQHTISWAGDEDHTKGGKEENSARTNTVREAFFALLAMGYISKKMRSGLWGE